MIAVASAPGNFLSRRLIRDTWGNRSSYFNSTVSITHEVVFIIGRPPTFLANGSISNELIERNQVLSKMIKGEF